MSDEPRGKKIIVAEDWKARVEAEREELAKERQPKGEVVEPSGAEAGDMPPASFQMLVTTLATEAMVGLGQIPQPTTGQASINLTQARYFIDTLDVLATKTQGNLTPNEEAGLRQLLYQLRLAFVAAKAPPAG